MEPLLEVAWPNLANVPTMFLHDTLSHLSMIAKIAIFLQLGQPKEPADASWLEKESDFFGLIFSSLKV